jgi:hypothetical protein
MGKVKESLEAFLTQFEPRTRGRERESLVLFISDEAEGLISSAEGFSNFRYALRELNKTDSYKIPLYFGVLVDTFGEEPVAQLDSHDHRDPSYRPFLEKETTFPPPLQVVQFCREPVGEWWAAKENRSVTLILSRLMYNQGRYLWSTFQDALDPTKLIELGRTCLLGGYDAESKVKPRADSAVSMALLGSRVAITFRCTEKTTLDMVRLHMGVCYHILPSRDSLLYGYPSEPVLSLAASSLLSDQESQFSWVNSLRRVSSLFQRGHVESGVHGELICRLLLTLAWDFCQKEKENGCLHLPVTVLEFLCSLGGESLVAVFKGDKPCQKKDDLLNSRVYFTHFVSVDDRVDSPNLLKSFASKGQAIFCQNNQQAMDLLIPVILDDDEQTPTFIAIQSSNRTEYSWANAMKSYDALSMGFPEAFTAPYLVLCMQVGPVKAPEISDLSISEGSKKDWTNTGTKSIIAMNGLSEQIYPFLKDGELLNVLQGFQQAWNDPVAIMEAQGQTEYVEFFREAMSPSYFSKGDSLL